MQNVLSFFTCWCISAVLRKYVNKNKYAWHGSGSIRCCWNEKLCCPDPKKKTWGTRRRLQLFLQNSREYYGPYNHDHQHLEGIKLEANTENGEGGDYGLIKACVSSSLEPVRLPPLFTYIQPTHTHTNAHTCFIHWRVKLKNLTFTSTGRLASAAT